MLREFKINYLEMNGNMEIIQSGSFEITENNDFIKIPVYDINQKEKRKRLKNPTRAMKKRQMRKEIEDEMFEK